MTVGIAEARPPFVQFERQLIEDREASLAAGSFRERAVDTALVTPIGSKDRYPFEVKAWFENLANEVSAGRFNPEWLQKYRNQYKAFCEGEEVPEDGTPLRSWPQISKGQVAACTSIHLRTVEDLAAANEEAINRLGMGGRALKQAAQAWLAAARGQGAAAAQITALQTEKDALVARNVALEARIARLEALAGAAVAPALREESSDTISAADILDDDDPPAPPPAVADEPVRRGRGRPRKIQ
jgi:hypothetical protein